MEEQAVIQLINQVHQLQRKLNRVDETGTTSRQIERIMDIFAESGYLVDNPLGQHYDGTRTDLAVTFGSRTTGTMITDVLKPVIYRQEEGESKLLQIGVVLI